MAVRPVLELGEMDCRPAQAARLIGLARIAVATDLVDTMRASPACVGLAAPQIGASLRAFAIDVSGHRKARTVHGELVLFDPELVAMEAWEVAREGCMSVPDFTGDVRRPSRIVVRARQLDGSELVLRTDGLEARAILHEMDHLDGLAFLDRLRGPEALHRRCVYRPATLVAARRWEGEERQGALVAASAEAH